MVLPTGLGQRALQSLNRPSALQFIGRPQVGAPATQPVPQNIMGLRQKVLEQQMRPQLTPAQQFRQLAGISAAERMGQTPPPPKAPTGMDGLLSGFMPEGGTPEMAGFGAAGQKLLELSGYREVPITMAEALGQAAGAYGQARGAALQQQKEEQAAQAAAERQARLDKQAREKEIYDRIMREQEFGLKQRKQAFEEQQATQPPVSGVPDIGDTREIHIGDGMFQTEQWVGDKYVAIGSPVLKGLDEVKPLSVAGKQASDLGYKIGTEPYRQKVMELLAQTREQASPTALQKEAADIFPDSQAPVGSPKYEEEMKKIRKQRAEWVNDIRKSPRGITQRAGVVLNADGKLVGRAIFNPRPKEGESPVMVEADGKLRPLQEGERSIEKEQMNKMLLPQKQYYDLEDELLSEKQSMRKLNEYATNIANSPVGGARLLAEFSTFAKTFFNEVLPENMRGLTFRELSLQLSKGELQGLIGASRIEVVGGGVMTEQDAIRILEFLGGDVSVLQNPERVAFAIKKILREKAEGYNVNARQFNEQSAYRNAQRSFVEPVQVEKLAIDKISPTDVDLSVAPEGFNPEDWAVLPNEDKLEYLEAGNG